MGARRLLGSEVLSKSILAVPVRLALVLYALDAAYRIRLHAIEEYGLVIHEFDPWFNYRATEYLDQHGLEKFFKWYDYMAWYPLGRPVGTTIYPGMQMTSVFLKNQLNAAGYPISLNDVCCYVPAWFGVLATALCALLAWECTGNANIGTVTALIMAIIPAHIMRSVGGGYDNESVAMAAMCLTFYCWVLSLRGGMSWVIGIVTGFAYGYMVAAWGGYIFVLNMIALHALFLLMSGRFSWKLHHAYTLFYIIGTCIAIQVPVVGWTPLKSMEQLGAFGVLGLMQIFLFVDIIKRFDYTFPAPIGRVHPAMTDAEVKSLRWKVTGLAGAGFFALCIICLPSGHFGPLSSRVRALFLQHSRTGNPLVDSVAEHQPGSARSYWQYMHNMCYFGFVGFIINLFSPNDQKYFLTCYACTAYYFSMKMVRLVLLMSPITSCLAGVAIARGIEWALDQASEMLESKDDSDDEEDSDEDEVLKGGPALKGTSPRKRGSKAAPKAAPKKQDYTSKKMSKGNMEKKYRNGRRSESDDLGIFMENFSENWNSFYNQAGMSSVRKGLAVALCLTIFTSSRSFAQYSEEISWSMSGPSIMYKAQMNNGQTIMVDDYREAYWWLRDNTPEDSRVMAWWDYGYQIGGIANRTTIADGNTWNHEHIATLGRCLTSPEKAAHRIVRHLADYVLVWTGGGGDDLAKSPHMARIGTSVYKDICPGDPTCSQFGFTDRQQTPTPMMAASLLYKLHGHNQVAGVTVDPQRFREVYTSKYNKIRIFKVLKVSQKSKEWVEAPENRICDAPGSWYCTGQYPPALSDVLNKKKAFKQLEDFNVETTDEDKAYQEEYMKRMAGGASTGPVGQGYEDMLGGTFDPDSKAARKKKDKKKKRGKKGKAKEEDESSAPAVPDTEDDDEYMNDEEVEEGIDPVTGDEIDYDPAADAEIAPPVNAAAEAAQATQAPLEPHSTAWADTPATTRMWGLLHGQKIEELSEWIAMDPSVVHIRASDGRGPLWWAYEYGQTAAIELMLAAGVDPEAKDSDGNPARVMAQGGQ